MRDEDSSGLRLIAAHLAQVKLEAAEYAYKSERLVSSLNAELEEQRSLVSSLRKDIDHYQRQIKQLQSENTYKTLATEREKWKKLVDTLRQDNNALRHQLSNLFESDSPSSPSPDLPLAPPSTSQNCNSPNESKSPSSPRIDEGDTEDKVERCLRVGVVSSGERIRRRIGSSRGEGYCTEAEWLQLQGEVKSLRSQVELKEVEILALKSKLDRELELKWEKEHQQTGGWKRSLLESFAEVLAPYPDTPPQSPSAHNSKGSASTKASPSDVVPAESILVSRSF